MEQGIKAGTTGHTRYWMLRKASDGTPYTGLLYNSAGLAVNYRRQRGAPVDVVLATLANNAAAWASGGFIEVDSVKRPGEYRFDLPDAAVAAGSTEVTLALNGTVGGVAIRAEEYRIPLTVFDPLTEGAVLGTLTPAAIQAIMDSPLSGMTTPNSFGKAVYDTVSAVATVLSDVDDVSGGGIQTVMDAITTLLGRLPAPVATKLANLIVNPTTGAVIADLDIANAVASGVTQRMALRALFAGAATAGLRTGFDGSTNPNVFHVKALTGGQPDAFTGTVDVNGNITAAAWNLGVLADNTKW